MLVHWLLLSGVSYCDDRERVIIFANKTKKKEHSLGQSGVFSGATPLMKIK
jgi:hypothetical protein